MSTAPFDLSQTYVSLQNGGGAEVLEVGPDFWTKTVREMDGTYLVTSFSFTEDWPHWEMHPEGEELIILLCGHMDLILNDGSDGPHQTATLNQPGQTFLMPRGTWHRAVVHNPTQAVFVTAGKGTQHRPL